MPDQPSPWSRLEPGRVVTGALAEWLFRLYGGAGATSVALSDAETIRGKAVDALLPIQALTQKYDEMQYVVAHRAEIQAAVDYLNTHTLSEADVDRSITQSTQTLDAISTTSTELDQVRAALSDGRLPNVRDAFEHAQAAFQAMPDRESIDQLVTVARQAKPLVEQVDVLVPVYYGNLFSVVDNFARDEIWGTVAVMLAALIVCGTVARFVGFVIRRGRPGLIARLMQSWGAKRYHDWYVDNPHAMSRNLDATARVRAERDIVADPERALTPESLRRLERYFEERTKG